ncbi:sugar O-acetyltransferase [Zobellella sp. An-6]|uniref:sugar O-acetyltransferase n=1 Tax=Zobellella sp. An-6 TaxID=3400218 RepID=UPI004042B212
MNQKARMLAGKLYVAQGPELKADCHRSRRLTRLFNATTEEQQEERLALLKELFAATGERLYIEPPFRCDYGGNIQVGEGFYANFDCIILDVCRVRIGERVLFGPRVCVYTASHPIDAGVRAELELGRPVTIGDDVWVGGNTVINPGVRIGNRVVIGAGSVVTRDIPDDVVAAGNPCRVIRPITEEDRRYWQQLRDQYRAEMEPPVG